VNFVSTGIDKVISAVLEKAKKEAKKIIERAEEEAKKIIEEAERRRSERIKEEKERVIKEYRAEASRKIAEARRESYLKITSEKVKILDELMREVESCLRERRGFNVENSLRNLILESIKEVGEGTGVRIYVSKRDLEVVERLRSNLEVGKFIAEVIPRDDIDGGVVVETLDGKVKIVNTYDARLKQVRSKLLPHIAKLLFQG